METQFHGSDQYIVSDDLMRTVHIAITLQKPLLIKGEPGTGKTMLARAISQSLHKPLYIWNIKSTTKAQEGLYMYDTVQRLYDSQFGGSGVDQIARYIKLGKLGEAFTSNEQAVLLIDEIDKADLEFPNDLLWELDQMEFYIPETQETISCQAQTDCNYHIKRRKRIARCIPTPVYFSLYRFSRSRRNGNHSPCPHPRSGCPPPAASFGFLLYGTQHTRFAEKTQHI